MRIIQRLRMPGLLSFPPDMGFFDLQSLNVHHRSERFR